MKKWSFTTNPYRVTEECSISFLLPHGGIWGIFSYQVYFERPKKETGMKRQLTFFDHPKNVKRLLTVFYLSLILLLGIDFFIPKHPEFPWEGAVNFFAAYGFISCVMLIFIAKILRRFIKRNEDYYDK